MPIITLPNGDQKQFDQAVSVMEVAQSIGPGLAKNTVAGLVNDRLVDACDLITEDATLQIITPKDEEGVEIIRHSCAHLVGHAVKQLFPEAKMVIGPVIEEGFYYDIWMPRPFTLDDLAAIEERMKKLIDQDYDVVKKMTPRDEVIAEFTARGEEYKLRLIADMPNETQMGLYYHQDYLDMCRGPHVPNTKFLKSFKLTKISGAYWRGDAKNEQLQRIYANYADNMFTTHSENRNYAVKPMNCPCHVQVFNQGLKSYRDLPIRLAEFGSCHRNEPSGSLHGIMRVRGFTQDDAHIFCTKEQIGPEVADFIKLTLDVYKDFGFEEVQMKLSTRPEKRVGDDALWDMAEKSLADALDAAGLDWELQPGEGAFYGPKIEFSLKDCLGRVWQCGTIQCDFNLPERLEASYVTEDNDRDQPVMLHRAILGSFERFIGILIEHYAGFMPPWLAPVQACVMNITDSQAAASEQVVAKLKENGIRAISDLRNEKIGFKIRERTLERIPYLLVLGDREVEEGTVNVRTRSGTNLGTMSIDAFIDLVKTAVAERGRYIVE